MNYTSFNDDLKSHFQQKIAKIALATGQTCPTRDGSRGRLGCHYCSEAGAYFLDTSGPQSITAQIERAKAYYRKRIRATGFLAYFQSYTPTYGPLDELEGQLREALADSEIVGLSVCTRPDCLSDRVLDLLARYMIGRYHWLEIGLQTSHNRILDAIGRGHSYEDFLESFGRAKALGFRICVHVILGLPGETEEMMRETIQRLVDLGVQGIKFHHLHILKGSVFEAQYQRGEITCYSLDEYAVLIGRLLPLIPKAVVIHRLFGDAPKGFLMAPDWLGGHKIRILQAIEGYLRRNGVAQGMGVSRNSNNIGQIVN